MCLYGVYDEQESTSRYRCILKKAEDRVHTQTKLGSP